MNSLLKTNHTLKKFFNDSGDTFFGRTIEDLLNDNFFDSFDANMREEHSSYRLEIAVPGMTRNDITIRVDDRVIWVTACREEENKSWRSTEFSSKHIQRSFALPTDADANNIRANCRNGLLSIQIEKKQTNGAHRVIRVSGEESTTATPDSATSWWTRLIDKAHRLLIRKRS